MAFRTYKRHLTPADKRAKAIIEACAASGAGIESLPEAPNFRYTPRPQAERKLEYGPPSKRGSIACGKNPHKVKGWTPQRLCLDTMYWCRMKGDSKELTTARAAWARGNPEPLRLYLSGNEWG